MTSHPLDYHPLIHPSPSLPLVVWRRAVPFCSFLPSFLSMLAVLTLWFGISVPLVFLGIDQ